MFQQRSRNIAKTQSAGTNGLATNPPAAPPIQCLISASEFERAKPLACSANVRRIWDKITVTLEDLERFKSDYIRIKPQAEDTRRPLSEKNLLYRMQALTELERLVNRYFSLYPIRVKIDKENEELLLFQILDDLETEWTDLAEEFPPEMLIAKKTDDGKTTSSSELKRDEFYDAPLKNLYAKGALKTTGNHEEERRIRGMLYRLSTIDQGNFLFEQMDKEIAYSKRKLHLSLDRGEETEREGARANASDYLPVPARPGGSHTVSPDENGYFSPAPDYLVLASRIGLAFDSIAPGKYNRAGLNRTLPKLLNTLRKEMELPTVPDPALIRENPLSSVPLRPPRKLGNKAEDEFVFLDTGLIGTESVDGPSVDNATTAEEHRSEPQEPPETSLTPWAITQREDPVLPKPTKPFDWVSTGKMPTKKEDTERREALLKTLLEPPEVLCENANFMTLFKPSQGAFGDVYLFRGTPGKGALKILRDERMDQEAERELLAASLIRLLGNKVTAPKGQLLYSDSPEVDTLITKTEETSRHIAGFLDDDESGASQELEGLLTELRANLRAGRFQRSPHCAILWDQCPGKTLSLFANEERRRRLAGTEGREYDTHYHHPEERASEYLRPLMRDRDFSEGLGELYFYDILLGNPDRFSVALHHGNILYDPESRQVQAIDQSLGLFGANRMLGCILHKGKGNLKHKDTKATGYTSAEASQILESPVPNPEHLKAFGARMEYLLSEQVEIFLQDFLSKPTRPSRIIAKLMRLYGLAGLQGNGPLAIQYGFAQALYRLPSKEFLMRDLGQAHFKNFPDEAFHLFRAIDNTIQKVKSVSDEHYLMALSALNSTLSEGGSFSMKDFEQGHPAPSMRKATQKSRR
ncbi:hypothetical protein FUAX_50290 (plasmid) [Fulvitalea axinellae]|uniref:Uncharacterized protein n=1 Tax=Fulvitalea axinellae TaxID=1182444 RepID=A0AAU9CXR5_9BACT|nr:hypothetical protein FUAX_50290 [Fulvitalea axinellae]